MVSINASLMQSVEWGRVARTDNRRIAETGGTSPKTLDHYFKN